MPEEKGGAKVNPRKVSTTKVWAVPNVYERIANIQQSIHTVIKGGFNEHFKYKFARERDVIAEVKPLLGKERLVITHSLVKEEQVGDITKLTIRFRITNVNDKDDAIEADAIGYGKDSQDKGAPKAYTMALKYFLSKMFLIETGDDAEESRGKKGAEPASAKFETAKRMVKESRNVDGLVEYAEKLEGGKTFSASQKKELQALLKSRVDELQSRP